MANSVASFFCIAMCSSLKWRRFCHHDWKDGQPPLSMFVPAIMGVALFFLIYGGLIQVNNCANFHAYTWHQCQPTSLIIKTSDFEAQGFVNFTTQPGNCSYWNILAFQCSSKICVQDMTQQYSQNWECATPHIHECSEIPSLQAPSDECGKAKTLLIFGCLFVVAAVLMCSLVWYKFTKMPHPDELLAS